jgi:hypothetical protein
MRAIHLFLSSFGENNKAEQEEIQPNAMPKSGKPR